MNRWVIRGLFMAIAHMGAAVSEHERSILLITDSPNQLSFLHQALVGFDRRKATDAKEGMEAFKHQSPDITIIDLDMAHDQGWQMLQEVRQFDERAFVIGLSGSHRYLDQQNALKAGASAYIIKPFSRQLLLQQLELYTELEKRRAVRTADERSRAYEAKVVREGEGRTVLANEAPHVEIADILRQWHVLIVDPIYINREQARKALSQLGCRVSVAASEEDARERVSIEDMDLIFVNESLHAIDSYQLTHELRQHYMSKARQPYIIGMLDRDGEGYGINRWRVAGMDEVLYKPIPVNIMCNRVLAYAEQFRAEVGSDYGELAMSTGGLYCTLDAPRAAFRDDYAREALGYVHQALSHGLAHAASDLSADIQKLMDKQPVKLEEMKAVADELYEGMTLLRHYTSLCLATPSRTLVALEEVVGDVVRALKPTLARTGATVLAGKLPEVQGNHIQLAQLFAHLIGNALKYRSDKPPAVHISAMRDAQGWRVEVADNGRGIDPASRQIMFMPFQRLHEDGDVHGHGMGLAICKRIVELHGGIIQAEPRTGGGSVFSFTLN